MRRSPGEDLPQSFPTGGDFGSLEFDKYDDFNILARRISEVTADITRIHVTIDRIDTPRSGRHGATTQLTLGMRDEIARAHYGADRDTLYTVPSGGTGVAQYHRKRSQSRYVG